MLSTITILVSTLASAPTTHTNQSGFDNGGGININIGRGGGDIDIDIDICLDVSLDLGL